MPDEREAFDAWYARQKFAPTEWMVWQAAIAWERERVASMVAAEPTTIQPRECDDAE